MTQISSISVVIVLMLSYNDITLSPYGNHDTDEYDRSREITKVISCCSLTSDDAIPISALKFAAY